MKLVNKGKAQICRACLEVKPLDQFHLNKQTETGYSKYCKACGVRPGGYSAEARYSKLNEWQ